MPIDINAAERFVHADARLLDRHGLAALLHGAPVAPVLDALRAYRNPDGQREHRARTSRGTGTHSCTPRESAGGRA